ncbi:MAG TPA: PRC-barrel domain-containing protein [Nitrospira sp.]|nr:PRC-barrel domain-containing protein [Nitrospira sp.]
MKTARLLLPAITATGMLGIVGIMNPGHVSSEEAMSELGNPLPGTTQDFEDTRKEPDPAKMHSPESNRQVTLGGAQYFVVGKVVNINGQQFDIQKIDDGERVRLVVNQDSNLDCSAAPSTSDEQQSESLASERIPIEQQAPAASERQREQGQRKNETARGAGFRIGQCDFKAGDHVKAEVDDMGRVTTMKYLAQDPAMPPHEIGVTAETGVLAMTGQEEKPGQVDMTGAGGSMPKDYTVVPVPVGELKTTEGNELLAKPVQDLQGRKIGTLEKLIVDTYSGRIEYAVVAIENGTHLHPVPWSAIQVKHNGSGPAKAMIDTSKYQIMPSLMRDDSKDLSPSVKQLVKDMEVLREREPGKSQSREMIVKEPAGSGPMGEDKAGGDGLSGTRALPPEKDSPGYKHEKEKRD